MNKYLIIGITLISLSTILFVKNNYEETQAGIASDEILKNIKNDEIKNETITINNKKETITIGNYNYIGTLLIPSLNLELPIIDKCDYKRLKNAPCKYYGAIKTNDLIICGHSYKKHFKYLKELKQGDKIIITASNNEVYIYEVLELEVLEATDVEKMINNDFDLTLYTCTDGGLRRLAVRSNRIN